MKANLLQFKNPSDTRRAPLLFFDDMINDPVFQRFLRRHEVIPVGIDFDLFQGLSRPFRDDFIEMLTKFDDPFRGDLEVSRLPTCPPREAGES